MQLKTTIFIWSDDGAEVKVSEPVHFVKTADGMVAKTDSAVFGKVQPRYNRLIESERNLVAKVEEVDGRNVSVGIYGNERGSIRGTNGTFELKDGRLTFSEFGKSPETRDVAGARATVETGEQLNERVALTRIALVGIFALGMKKRSGGERYIVIEGEDFAWALEVTSDQANDAIQFATLVNSAAKDCRKQSEPKQSDNQLLEQLERLVSLKESGMLDDVEFKAAKARVLGL